MIRVLTMSTLSATLLSFSFRPWGNGIFALAAMLPMVSLLLAERRPWRGALATGVAWLGLGIPALEGTAQRLWWSFPLLITILVSGWVIVGWLVVSISNRSTPVRAALSVPLGLAAAEYLTSRKWLMGDMAVGLLAYTQADTPLKAFASWSGTSAVALGVGLVGAGLHLLWQRRPREAGYFLLPVVGLLFVASPGITHASEIFGGVKVGVVQGAQSDVDRLLAGYVEDHAEELMRVYGELAVTAVKDGAELIVLGETVLPRGTTWGQAPQPLREALAATPLAVVGAHEWAEDGWFNSVFVWGGDTLEPVYRKRALVPIIEGNYTPGTSSTPVMLQGALVGLGICLDTVHAGLVRESVLQGAELLVFITDDTFAGFTSTPHVHLRTAALRAAETGRAVVFANESGPSAMFDPRGNVVAYLPHGEPGVVVAELPLAFGTTPFVALGDWLGWLCVVATAVLAGVAALRPHRLERLIMPS